MAGTAPVGYISVMGAHEPFDQGFAAFARGAAIGDCPFASDDPARPAWETGWRYAAMVLARP